MLPPLPFDHCICVFGRSGQNVACTGTHLPLLYPRPLSLRTLVARHVASPTKHIPLNIRRPEDPDSFPTTASGTNVILVISWLTKLREAFSKAQSENVFFELVDGYLQGANWRIQLREVCVHHPNPAHDRGHMFHTFFLEAKPGPALLLIDGVRQHKGVFSDGLFDLVGTFNEPALPPPHPTLAGPALPSSSQTKGSPSVAPSSSLRVGLPAGKLITNEGNPRAHVIDLTRSPSPPYAPSSSMKALGSRVNPILLDATPSPVPSPILVQNRFIPNALGLRMEAERKAQSAPSPLNPVGGRALSRLSREGTPEAKEETDKGERTREKGKGRAQPRDPLAERELGPVSSEVDYKLDESFNRADSLHNDTYNSTADAPIRPGPSAHIDAIEIHAPRSREAPLPPFTARPTLSPEGPQGRRVLPASTSLPAVGSTPFDSSTLNSSFSGDIGSSIVSDVQDDPADGLELVITDLSAPCADLRAAPTGSYETFGRGDGDEGIYSDSELSDGLDLVITQISVDHGPASRSNPLRLSPNSPTSPSDRASASPRASPNVRERNITVDALGLYLDVSPPSSPSQAQSSAPPHLKEHEGDFSDDHSDDLSGGPAEMDGMRSAASEKDIRNGVRRALGDQGSKSDEDGHFEVDDKGTLNRRARYDSSDEEEIMEANVMRFRLNKGSGYQRDDDDVLLGDEESELDHPTPSRSSRSPTRSSSSPHLAPERRRPRGRAPTGTPSPSPVNREPLFLPETPTSTPSPKVEAGEFALPILDAADGDEESDHDLDSASDEHDEIPGAVDAWLPFHVRHAAEVGVRAPAERVSAKRAGQKAALELLKERKRAQAARQEAKNRERIEREEEEEEEEDELEEEEEEDELEEEAEAEEEEVVVAAAPARQRTGKRPSDPASTPNLGGPKVRCRIR